MMHRRAFLATPLVFGLRELLAQDPASAPAWWAAALRRMKDTGRCGVVLAAPAGRDGVRFGTELAALLPAEDPALRRLLGEAVFVVLSPALARRLVLRDGETFNRLLLAPDGSRLAADVVAPQVFARPMFFVGSFRPFVEGSDGARLAERAAAQEASVPTEALRAIGSLASASPAIREQAAADLARQADRCYPWLLQRLLSESDVDLRGRLALVLDRVVLSADPRVAGPALPYGVKRVVAEASFPEGGNCAACGLVVASAPARDFLECLTE